MKRHMLAAGSVALWLLAVLLFGAGIDTGDHWQPQHEVVLDGQALRAISGSAAPTVDGLVVSDTGKFGQALQSWPLSQPMDAADHPILHYSVKDFPRGLELAFFFRTAADPDNVVSITLPWPDDSGASVNLANNPAWQGRITEVGLTEYALPGLVPDDYRFEPFTVHEIRLQERSITGLLDVLATRCGAWLPWSSRSINLVTPGTIFSWHSSPTLLLALVLGGSWLILIAFSRKRRQWLRLAVPLMLVSWLLLDVHWTSQLQRNHQLTSEMYAGMPWNERKHIVADHRLQERAGLMREALARQPADSRILFWTPTRSGFSMGRLGYFLRPWNVAPLPDGMDGAGLPRGTLLMINNFDNSWVWHADRGVLQHGAQVFHGNLLWHEDGMMLLRLTRGNEA